VLLNQKRRFAMRQNIGYVTADGLETNIVVHGPTYNTATLPAAGAQPIFCETSTVQGNIRSASCLACVKGLAPDWLRNAVVMLYIDLFARHLAREHDVDVFMSLLRCTTATLASARSVDLDGLFPPRSRESAQVHSFGQSELWSDLRDASSSAHGVAVQHYYYYSSRLIGFHQMHCLGTNDTVRLVSDARESALVLWNALT